MSDKALAIAYAVKRKKKMAGGGQVDKSYLDELQDSVNEAFKNEPQAEHQDSQEEKYAKIREKNKSNMGYAHGGSVHGGPDNIVKRIRQAIHSRKKMAQGGELPEDMDYLAENDSYPDEEYREFDSLDPEQIDFMADGGEVDKRQEAQESMRKAFHFEKGGPLLEEDATMKKKKRMKQIMASMSQRKIS